MTPITSLLPKSPDDLHTFLRDELHIRVARVPLIAGHAAPFDYLAHAFFEGGAWLPDPQPLPADCVVWANRGGGKTFLGALATMLDLVFKPGIEIRVLGGSMDQSRRMHAHLRRIFDPRQHPRLAELVEGKITDRRLRLVNTSEVELLAQSQASVRGTRVQKLRCDEVELFDRDVWAAAQLTTRSKPLTLADGSTREVRGSVECLSTMHMPHGLMHELVQSARDGTRRLFQWGVVDVLATCGPEHACSPSSREPEAPAPGDASHAPPDAPADVEDAAPPTNSCPLLPECQGKAKARDAELGQDAAGHLSIKDALAMKGRVSLATWNAEMLCLHPKRTDAVLPEFDPKAHVFASEEFNDAGDLICGMDFGFRAPTVVLWARVHQGVIRVVDERHESGVLLAEHIDAIKQGRARRQGWPAPEWIGVDPAGKNQNEQTGKGHVELMRAAGLDVRWRRFNVQDGLELIRARLRPAGPNQRPTLFVHERCAKLIESLERYHYPADDPESLRPVKRDGFDHAVDALRYMLHCLDKPFKASMSKYAEV